MAAEDKKKILLRLESDLAEQLQALAEVDGRPVSQIIRDAITAHVARRREDPKFHELLEDNLARHQRLLKRLADGD